MPTAWRTVQSLAAWTWTREPAWFQLTRAREHVPFVAPLTVLGALLAVHQTGSALDLRLGIVVAANVLAVAFAFMINDIEDAEDDAADPDKAARNAVSLGTLTPRRARTWSTLAAILAAALYAAAGGWVAPIGLAILVLSLLYSWRRVRLKSLPIVDVASHSLMLGGLLVSSGSAAYDPNLDTTWTMAVIATAVSAYGQLYNQIRDRHADRAAGLRNTVAFVGVGYAKWMMYIALAVALAALLAGVLAGDFPIGLGLAAVLGLLVGSLLSDATDMRGTAALDVSGRMQARALIALNTVALSWLLWIVAEPWLAHTPIFLMIR